MTEINRLGKKRETEMGNRGEHGDTERTCGRQKWEETGTGRQTGRNGGDMEQLNIRQR